MIKKILFVGLGSAGQRHLRNILELVGNDVEISAYRFHKSERVFDADMKVIDNQSLSEKYNIKEFDDYQEALDNEPDMVVIANPNSMHIPYALEAAKRGCDLFIEKPLSTTLEHVEELLEEIKQNDIVCQVGFQQRYHPCVALVKQYLENNKFGKIIFVNAEIGERLSRMHSYEDYRGMLEARKDLGGGVVLCQVHELDYISWFFGEPKSVYSIGGRRSDFDIDVEDVATTMLRFEKSGEEFAVMLHQDYLQYPPSRRCKIIGTQGKAEIDLLKCTFVYEEYDTGERIAKKFEFFNRNDMFIAEMKDFLLCRELRRNPACDADAALISTKMGMAIRKSFVERREIKYDEL